MKRLLLAIAMILCVSNPVLAQRSNVYIRAGVGYGLPLGGSTGGQIYSGGLRTSAQYSGTKKIISGSQGYYDERVEMKRNSFSEGLSSLFGIGLWCSEHIGVELTTGVGLNEVNKTSNTIEFVDKNTYELKIRQKEILPVLLTPSIILQVGNKTKLYTRVGVTLPLATAIRQDIVLKQTRYNDANGQYITEEYKFREKYKMRFNPGVSAAIGLKAKIGGPVSFWGEIGMLSMVLYNKKSETEEFYYNGIEYTRYLPEDALNTEYTFNNTKSTKNELPTSSVPFSNINLQIGFCVDL